MVSTSGEARFRNHLHSSSTSLPWAPFSYLPTIDHGSYISSNVSSLHHGVPLTSLLVHSQSPLLGRTSLPASQNETFSRKRPDFLSSDKKPQGSALAPNSRASQIPTGNHCLISRLASGLGCLYPTRVGTRQLVELVFLPKDIAYSWAFTTSPLAVNARQAPFSTDLFSIFSCDASSGINQQENLLPSFQCWACDNTVPVSVAGVAKKKKTTQAKKGGSEERFKPFPRCCQRTLRHDLGYGQNRPWRSRQLPLCAG